MSKDSLDAQLRQTFNNTAFQVQETLAADVNAQWPVWKRMIQASVEKASESACGVDELQ